MRRVRRTLPLLALLAGCVDFVDPVGLGLARDTRIELDFELRDDPLRAPCAGAAPASGDSAVLCVQGLLDPGVTPLGEERRVLDDTLWAMGRPLLPSGASGGIRRYAGRFVLPLASLEEVPFTATLPRVEGVEAVAREIRWYAVGRADPDTLPRTPGSGVRLRLDPPAGASSPAPGFQFWSLDVAGDTASASYNASGVPGAVHEFPSEVLDALGGSRFAGELRWQRSYSPSDDDVQLVVRFVERLHWRVETR